MRFTLKTLMAAVTVTAVMCCIFFALPGFLAVPILGVFWLLTPPALIAGLVYGRGYGRAFAIGCISAGGCMPLLWLYSSFSVAGLAAAEFDDMSAIVADDGTTKAVRIACGVIFVVVGISGLTSMGVRWLSLKMSARDATVESPEYSVLQRRLTTVESPAKVSTNGSPDPGQV